jgi:hypothetical protein
MTWRDFLSIGRFRPIVKRASDGADAYRMNAFLNTLMYPRASALPLQLENDIFAKKGLAAGLRLHYTTPIETGRAGRGTGLDPKSR